MIPQLSPIPHLRRSRWMVVDDNQEILNIMQLLLEQIHEGPVECFTSPRAAIEAVSTARINASHQTNFDDWKRII